MAINRSDHLKPEEIVALLSRYESTQELEVVHVRYKTRDEIRASEWKAVSDIQEFILGCMEEEVQPGGDIEVIFQERKELLVGHHDGVYWLGEASA